MFQFPDLWLSCLANALNVDRNLRDAAVNPFPQTVKRPTATSRGSHARNSQFGTHDNDLKGAVALARQVPSSSPAYTEAQTAIAHWQAQWQKGEAAIKIARKAIQQKNWTQASQQMGVLGELEPVYWRLQRADKLSRQILNGKQVQQALLKEQKLEAQKVAQSGQSHEGDGAIGAIAE
ncbi:MAG: hypothetical protein KME11_19495 [Timaviella obliquedivisa GSE-PSE-MK23-08B]|nr:hypothetical protein [Timaviella obliquedivisa GSE-PSE-MK23-08B]